MSSRIKGLVFAMEEGENLELSDNELSDTTTLIDNAIQQGNDVVDLTTAFEEATEEVETLENIQRIMSDSVDNNEGLDENSAELAQVAVENICSRLRINSSVIKMPALESFSSKNNSLVSTRIALEGITQVIKDIWEGIKRIAIKIGEKLMEFIDGIIDSLGSLEKTANGLLAKVNKTDFSDISNKGVIKSKTLATAFTIADNDLSTHGVLPILKSTYTSVENVESKIRTITKRLEKFNSFLSKGNVDIASTLATFVNDIQNPNQNFDHITSNTEDLYLINNTFISFTNNAGVIKFETNQRKTKNSDFEELEILDKSTCVSSLNETINIIRELRKLKAVKTVIQDSVKTTVATSNGIITAMMKTDTPVDNELLSELATYIRSYNSQIPNYISFILSNGMKTIRYSLEYVNASINKVA